MEDETEVRAATVFLEKEAVPKFVLMQEAAAQVMATSRELCRAMHAAGERLRLISLVLAPCLSLSLSVCLSVSVSLCVCQGFLRL